MAYDKTNRGAIFKNDRKESDNHPDYKGDLNVEGTDYWVSVWLKTAESGRKYMSVSVKQKEARPEPKKPSHDAAKARQLPRQSSGFDDMDDNSVPF